MTAYLFALMSAVLMACTPYDGGGMSNPIAASDHHTRTLNEPVEPAPEDQVEEDQPYHEINDFRYSSWGDSVDEVMDAEPEEMDVLCNGGGVSETCIAGAVTTSEFMLLKLGDISDPDYKVWHLYPGVAYTFVGDRLVSGQYAFDVDAFDTESDGPDIFEALKQVLSDRYTLDGEIPPDPTTGNMVHFCYFTKNSGTSVVLSAWGPGTRYRESEALISIGYSESSDVGWDEAAEYNSLPLRVVAPERVGSGP